MTIETRQQLHHWAGTQGVTTSILALPERVAIEDTGIPKVAVVRINGKWFLEVSEPMAAHFEREWERAK